MPTYAQPNVPSYLEGVINAFGNLTKVAIIGYLTTHGPSTAGEIALGIEVGVPTAKHNLYLLAAEGVVIQDPPASETRNGKRVKYVVIAGEVKRRYADLGEALGLSNDSE